MAWIFQFFEAWRPPEVREPQSVGGALLSPELQSHSEVVKMSSY